MKPITNTKCKHCGYTWYTKSILRMCTCPSCRKATLTKNLENNPHNEFKEWDCPYFEEI